jgi:type IV secretory pathway protease TraF
MTVVAIVSIALVATIAVPTNARLSWLIYDGPASTPLAFLAVENRTPSRRDTVLVRPSATRENLLANHGVVPRGLPLLKRVIAVGRDQICQSAGVGYVNGMVAAEALDHDREGRPLPFWQGCARIREGQIYSAGNRLDHPRRHSCGPHQCHLPWLFRKRSGSAPLASTGSNIALRPAATWWSFGHPQLSKSASRTMVSAPRRASFVTT